MQPDRTSELSALLARRLLVLDGAMGTMIQRHGLQEADYRGERLKDHPHDLKGNNDLLVLTQPGTIGVSACINPANAAIPKPVEALESIWRREKREFITQ